MNTSEGPLDRPASERSALVSQYSEALSSRLSRLRSSSRAFSLTDEQLERELALFVPPSLAPWHHEDGGLRSGSGSSSGSGSGSRAAGARRPLSAHCCCCSGRALRGMQWGQLNIVACCFSVMFLRYCVATFLSSFFASYCDDVGISETWSGLVMAAYPTGIALSSLFASLLVMRWGTRRSVVVGLLGTAAATLCFGLVPDMAGTWAAVGDAGGAGGVGGGHAKKALVANDGSSAVSNEVR